MLKMFRPPESQYKESLYAEMLNTMVDILDRLENDGGVTRRDLTVSTILFRDLYYRLTGGQSVRLEDRHERYKGW
jgi:hypothetical protein